MDRRFSLPPSFSCADMSPSAAAAAVFPDSPSHRLGSPSTALFLSPGSPSNVDLLNAAGASLQELADALTMPRIAKAFQLNARSKAAATLSNASLEELPAAAETFIDGPLPRISFVDGIGIPAAPSQKCSTNDGADSSPRAIHNCPSSSFYANGGASTPPGSALLGLLASSPTSKELPSISLLEYAEEAVLIQKLSHSFDSF
jgi:hypothetical protein